MLARQNRSLAALARDADTVLGAAGPASAGGSARRSTTIGRGGRGHRRAPGRPRGDAAAPARASWPSCARRCAGSARLADAGDAGAGRRGRRRAVGEHRSCRSSGPFSAAATTALESLGRGGRAQHPRRARRAAARRRPGAASAGAARPVGAHARRRAGLLPAQRTASSSAMDFLFYGVAAINGYDAFGHYLRASLIVNQCSNYAVAPVAGCSANFRASGGGRRARSWRPRLRRPSPPAAPAVPAPAAGAARAPSTRRTRRCSTTCSGGTADARRRAASRPDRRRDRS